MSLLLPLLLCALPAFAIYLRLRSLPPTYSLRHYTLNPPSPVHPDGYPTSMWQNMGFWARPSALPGRLAQADYCAAAEALVREVLRVFTGKGRKGAGGRIERVLEVGCGCGDSVPVLAKMGVKRYVGVNLTAEQVSMARGRYKDVCVHGAEFICADGGAPEAWDRELRGEMETWEHGLLLGVDSLYHLDRQRLLRWVPSGWDFAAFDLVRGPGCTGWKRVVLAVLLWASRSGGSVGGMPTAEEYMAMLVRNGWKEEDIEMVDVSENVFPGVSRYLRERTQVKWKIGGRVAGWWWSSQTVRGYIVVAKNKQ